jgi:hypothetical protein
MSCLAYLFKHFYTSKQALGWYSEIKFENHLLQLLSVLIADSYSDEWEVEFF